jgi:hypothetical protein
MTNVTNKQLMDISAALNYLSSMDTPAWYQVGRNLKRIEKPIEEINTARDAIIQKFIQKDDEGKPIYTDNTNRMYDLGENQEEADKLWKELQGEETEVEFYNFKYELLQGTKLNARLVAPLIDTIILED